MIASALRPARLLDRLRRILTSPIRLKRQVQALTLQQAASERQIARLSDALTHLDAQLRGLERNHEASVEWLQKTYPEIVAAVGRKIEHAQLEEQVEKLVADLHRELQATRHITGAASQSAATATDTDPAFYRALENSFRGTREEIRGRLCPYVPLLQDMPECRLPLIDIGCGRGEWLELLQEHSLPARGVDLNPINSAGCRARNLDVVTDDALHFLQHLPAESVGTVTAFHLVEHLPFPVLEELTRQALRTLKPGGLLIYETPNPENLLVATRSFWIDPTHRRPLPPELLEFLVVQKGFRHLETWRLHPGQDVECAEPTLKALLCGPRDYAVIAEKPAR